MMNGLSIDLGRVHHLAEGISHLSLSYTASIIYLSAGRAFEVPVSDHQATRQYTPIMQAVSPIKQTNSKMQFLPCQGYQASKASVDSKQSLEVPTGIKRYTCQQH